MKAYFLSRLLREKVLLLAFAALGAGIWLSGVMERFGTTLRAISATSEDLKVQQLWLSRKERIEREAALAIEHLDPGKSFDSVRLQNELNAMARSAGLASYNVDDPRTSRTSQFAVHSARFSVRNAEMRSLIAFYQALAQKAPYLGIEEFRLSSNPSNPTQLVASWRVTSVEIAK